MDNILGAGVGIITIGLAILGIIFVILLILLPINVLKIKEILQNIDENLIKNNQMSVHNNKRLQEIIGLLETNKKEE